MMTLEQFSVYEGQRPSDLIRGELVTMSAGGLHWMIASAINIRSDIYLLTNDIGRTFMADTTFVLSHEDSTGVRPDAAHLRHDRVPAMPELS